MGLFDWFKSAEPSVSGGGIRDKVELLEQEALRLIDEGNAIEESGRLMEAMQRYEAALKMMPNLARGHLNRGNILLETGRPDDAINAYATALLHKPDYAAAHFNMGNACLRSNRHEAAQASYNQAIALKPDFVDAYVALGNTLDDLGQPDAALLSYRRALALRPDFVEVYSNLLFTLNYHPDLSAAEIFKAYQEYDDKFARIHRSDWRPCNNHQDRNRRLKIGYVSADFRHHSVRHFLEPLLAHHDKRIVEVYAYAELAREDAVTARYKSYAEHWIPTFGLSDAALAERIRKDGIDILVDLAGHTGKNRLQVFARKPSPVSLSWLGYGYTTGLSAVDYLLTDKASAPEGSEALFSEVPWRLATPSLVYRPAEKMGLVSELPAVERGFVTFGTLTRAVRINHRTIRVWSAILKRVNGARLVIDSSNYQDCAMQNLLAEKFSAHGIDRSRLEIGFHSPPWDVLRGIDIGLDCFPHNSGTTLFETLYMGIPYVSLIGRPSVGRLGSAILEGVGHPEWIAQTEDEYIEKAVALASDLPKLMELRANLRAEMTAGCLMDEAGFSRKVESAYRVMWIRWCDQQQQEHGIDHA